MPLVASTIGHLCLQGVNAKNLQIASPSPHSGVDRMSAKDLLIIAISAALEYLVAALNLSSFRQPSLFATIAGHPERAADGSM